ncbi:MAG: methyltransferase [Gammaproteobacteria bacterium]|nr:methyltransferase [Gammaproteobacteria bacterium]
MRHLLPPLLFVVCLLAGVTGHLLWPEGAWLTAPYTLLGLIPAGLGIWLLIRANALFTRAGTNIHTFRDPDVLVTEGVFRISRNPMYLGFLVLLAGAAVGLGSTAASVDRRSFLPGRQLLVHPVRRTGLQGRFWRRRTDADQDDPRGRWSASSS